MRKKPKLVIIGAGETAEIAHWYLKGHYLSKVVAFSAEREFIEEDVLLGLPVVPFEELEKTHPPSEHDAFVAVSFIGLNRLRTRLYDEAKRKGYNLISYRSSGAFIWENVKIGDNCFIFEDNVIQYHAKIGNNVTLWSGNHIGHRTVIGDNCFISSHVVISGFCEVGESCFFGVNSCVIDGVKIAKDCYIGAGAVVVKDTEEGKVYIGNPARILKDSLL